MKLLLLPVFLASARAYGEKATVQGKMTTMQRNSVEGEMTTMEMTTTTAEASCPPNSVNIDWMLGMQSHQMTVDVKLGGTVTFNWKNYHNVAAVPDKTAFGTCDKTNAAVLSSKSGYVMNADVAGTQYVIW